MTDIPDSVIEEAAKAVLAAEASGDVAGAQAASQVVARWARADERRLIRGWINAGRHTSEEKTDPDQAEYVRGIEDTLDKLAATLDQEDEQ